MKFANQSVTRTVATLALFGALTGCATIVNDRNVPVSIQSTPSEAEFVIKNSAGVEVAAGKTPQQVVLNAKKGYFSGEDFTVEYKLNGYTTSTVELKSSLSGWYWGNLLFGGLIGMLIVDPATGDMWSLPETAATTLAATTTDNAAHSLQIASIHDLTPAQKRLLVKIN